MDRLFRGRLQQGRVAPRGRGIDPVAIFRNGRRRWPKFSPRRTIGIIGKPRSSKVERVTRCQKIVSTTSRHGPDAVP
eukprot:4941238-Pyramimonas_sp.AAC.1